MQQTKLKIQMTRSSALALDAVIQEVINDLLNFETDADKLHIAALTEILFIIKPKLVFSIPKYTFKFSAVQCFALRLMWIQTQITGEHFNNELRQISNQIHQKFSKN